MLYSKGLIWSLGKVWSYICPALLALPQPLLLFLHSFNKIWLESGYSEINSAKT